MLLNRPSTVGDFMTAFTLLALDPSLQGLALWGPRSGTSDECIEWLANCRKGPVVRLPAYASPGDVGFVGAVGDKSTANFDGTALFHLLSPSSFMNLPEKARGGVLLIESADLLSQPTAATLRRTLASMPAGHRPLLIARSDAHPRTWPLLAGECAFWLEEPSPTRGLGHEGTPEDRSLSVLPDITTLNEAARRLRRFPPETLPFAEVVTRTPVPAAGPPPDRFVLRTALGLAALAKAVGATPSHIERALQLVVAPRQESSPADEQPARAAAMAPDPNEPAHAAFQPEENAKPARQSGGMMNGHGLQKPGPEDGTKNTKSSGDRPTIADRVTRGDDEDLRIVPPGDLFAALSLKSTRTERFHPNTFSARRRKTSATSPPGPVTGTLLRYRRGQPFSIAATLHAAMPWQRLRQGIFTGNENADGRQKIGNRAYDNGTSPKGHIIVLPEDLRSHRRRPRPKSLYILAVDGSGSMGQQRMQLAKASALGVLTGAYRERRYVALIDFRRSKATLLCPPGRSTSTVRRSITAMPSGGGTPLPAGLALARDVAQSWLRQHPDGTIRLVLFTDGKANVPLTLPDAGDGPITPRIRREFVQEELKQLARQLHTIGISVHIVDGNGRRPSSDVFGLARTLGATVLHIDRTYRRSTPGGTA